MARNFFRIFTENNPVMEDSKTFCIPEAKGLTIHKLIHKLRPQTKNRKIHQHMLALLYMDEPFSALDSMAESSECGVRIQTTTVVLMSLSKLVPRRAELVVVFD